MKDKFQSHAPLEQAGRAIMTRNLLKLNVYGARYNRDLIKTKKKNEQRRPVAGTWQSDSPYKSSILV